VSVREVLQLGDPDLRRVSREVGVEDDLFHLMQDLGDTLHHWRDTTTYGRGIAAPQIGVDLRVVHIDLGAPWTLVNPRIVTRSEETWTPWDACLSVSVQFFGQVTRHRWIEIEWDGVEGERHRLRAEDELAELLQHELDHLDGLLFTDRLVDTSTLCMRAEFERRHRADSPYG
jgi:peptide deformylase